MSEDLVKQAIGRVRFCRDRGEIKTPDLIDELIARIRELEAELAALREAPVTPAEAARVLLDGIPNPIFDQLKPVMIGEFHLDFVGADEDGNEINYARAVPWTEIKAIIRTALRALADAGEAG